MSLSEQFKRWGATTALTCLVLANLPLGATAAGTEISGVSHASSAEAPDSVLVEVDGHPIRTGDLALSSVLLAGVAETLSPEKVRNLVLAHLVDVRLAADAALAEGATAEIAKLAAMSIGDKVAPPPLGETPEARSRRLNYLETSALAEIYFNRREAKLGLDDASLRHRYDELVNAREIRFRYLVMDDKEAAEAARRRISLGEPFEKVARETSSDPDTAKKGGDLGYLLESSLTPAFAGLAKSLEPGRMSEVFKTEMGWNVAQLVDRRMVTAPSFDKLKGPMRKALVDDMRKSTTAELRARATIAWHTNKPPGF